jgi:hypothetical protein
MEASVMRRRLRLWIVRAEISSQSARSANLATDGSAIGVLRARLEAGGIAGPRARRLSGGLLSDRI